MKKGRWRIIAQVVLVLAAASGCAASHPDASDTGEKTAILWVTGMINCRERIPLPQDIWIRVELLDISGKDGPPRTLVMQEIAPEGRKFPIPFEISYSPEIIDPERAYTLRVKIFQGRRILFQNASAYNVITNGVRANVEVLVEPVPVPGGASRKEVL